MGACEEGADPEHGADEDEPAICGEGGDPEAGAAVEEEEGCWAKVTRTDCDCTCSFSIDTGKSTVKAPGAT